MSNNWTHWSINQTQIFLSMKLTSVSHWKITYLQNMIILCIIQTTSLMFPPVCGFQIVNNFIYSVCKKKSYTDLERHLRFNTQNPFNLPWQSCIKTQGFDVKRLWRCHDDTVSLTWMQKINLEWQDTCMFIYSLYNVYQPKSNTASNLKRGEKKGEK